MKELRSEANSVARFRDIVIIFEFGLPVKISF